MTESTGLKDVLVPMGAMFMSLTEAEEALEGYTGDMMVPIKRYLREVRHITVTMVKDLADLMDDKEEE